MTEGDSPPWYREIQEDAGPQTVRATCTIVSESEVEKGLPVFKIDLFNLSDVASMAYVKATIAGTNINFKLGVMPGGHTMKVFSVGDVMKPTGKNERCEVEITDCFCRVLAKVSGDILLGAEKRRSLDTVPKIQLKTKAKWDGASAINIGKIFVPRSESDPCLQVNIFSDGDWVTSFPLQASLTSYTKEIDILPQMISLGTKNGIKVQVEYCGEIVCESYSEMNIDAGSPKKAEAESSEKPKVQSPKKIGVPEKEKPTKAEPKVSSVDIRTAVSLEKGPIDVHRTDEDNRVYVGKILLMSCSKVNENLKVLVNMDGNEIFRTNLDIKPGDETSMEVRVPSKSLFRDFTKDSTFEFWIFDHNGIPISSESRTLGIRSRFDVDSSSIKVMTARFVNPFSQCIDRLVKQMDIEITGYQNDGKNVVGQIKAVFEAVCKKNMKYCMDTETIFELSSHYQRIRTPGQVIKERSFNCIEGSILLASAWEKICLEPVVLLTNDHAIPGVVVRSTSPISKAPKDKVPDLGDLKKYVLTVKRENNVIMILPLESTHCTGRASFQGAVESAHDELVKYQNSSEGKNKPIRMINIRKYRKDGVNPILMGE